MEASSRRRCCFIHDSRQKHQETSRQSGAGSSKLKPVAQRDVWIREPIKTSGLVKFVCAGLLLQLGCGVRRVDTVPRNLATCVSLQKTKNAKRRDRREANRTFHRLVGRVCFRGTTNPSPRTPSVTLHLFKGRLSSSPRPSAPKVSSKITAGPKNSSCIRSPVFSNMPISGCTPVGQRVE